MLQCVAVLYSVLQCAAVCCSVVHRFPVSCSVLQSHRNSTLTKAPHQMLETNIQILYVAQFLPKCCDAMQQNGPVFERSHQCSHIEPPSISGLIEFIHPFRFLYVRWAAVLQCVAVCCSVLANLWRLRSLEISTCRLGSNLHT